MVMNYEKVYKNCNLSPTVEHGGNTLARSSYYPPVHLSTFALQDLKWQF